MAQGNALIVRDNTDLSKGSFNQGQPGYPVPPDQYMAPSQLRDLFLQTALYRSIPTDAITWTAGATSIVKIPQTGLAQKITLLGQLTASVATNLTAAPTAKSPYSAISQVIYNDPSGNVRVNSPLFMLYLLHLMSSREGFDPGNGYIPGNAPGVTAQGIPPVVQTPKYVFANPTPATANANVRFWSRIPITMSDYDTRGGMLLESATSPSFIALTMNPTPMDTNTGASIESPYTNNSAATALTLAGNIQPVYYFWQPSYVRGPHGAVLPLPVDDLNMVHEVISQRNSSSLNANTDNRFTLPTGRSYYRVGAFYVNNNAAGIGAPAVSATGANGVNAVRFAYDNANYTLNEPIQAYYSRTRRELDRDLPDGAFRWDFRERPWDSTQYGQLDCILSFDNTTLTTPYIDYIRDCLYMAPLG